MQFHYALTMVIIVSYDGIPVLLQSILFAFIMGLIFQPFFWREWQRMKLRIMVLLICIKPRGYFAE